MLDLFRRGVKTWVAKVLLAILILSFAVWGIGDIFLGGGYSKVATVGDSEVSFERYASTVRREQLRMTMQRREAVSLADFRAENQDRQVLSALVRDAVYSEELDRLGVAISRNEVFNAIRSNPNFFNSDGKFDPGIYNQRIGQSGFRSDEYERATANLLNRSILGDAIQVGQPPEGAAELIAKWQGEERGLTQVVLLPAMAPEPEAPGDDVLKAWFDADKEPFRIPERRWGSYVRLNPSEIARDITPSDAEIEAEYEARIADYSVAPKRTIEQIVFEDEAKAQDAAKRIADGEASYEEIAAEQNVSVADLSLGEVSKGELPDAVDAAIFGTDEEGVVGPVEGPFGFSLLNITDVVKEEVRPLADVRTEVSDVIARRQALGVVRDRSARIDELRAGGASMEELAKELETEIVRFQGLAPDGTVAEGEVPDLAADPQFTAEVQAAMAGDERDVVQLTDGGYALVMVDKVEESHLPEFETVRERIFDAWAAEQRMDWLDKRAEELIAAAKTGELHPAETSTAPANAADAKDGAAPEEKTGTGTDDTADTPTNETAGSSEESSGEVVASDEKPESEKEEAATVDNATDTTASEENPGSEASPASGIAAIGKAVGVEPVELPPSTRSAVPPAFSPDLTEAAFAAEQGALLHGRNRGDTAVIILSVREIVPLEGDALTARVTALEEEMQRGIVADTAEFFGRALEKRYPVEVNEAAIDSVFEQLGQSGY